MADQFTPQNNGKKDCSDKQTWGQKSVAYDYIVKSITGDEDYPVDACDPWVHGNAQIDNLQVNGTATGSFSGTFNGTINTQSWKGFDIQHPNKSNHRLRHICLEGPEGGVYYRGRLTNSNVIDLPDYWYGLINPESITVSLTQIGYSQDLIVEKIVWGKKIHIKSGTGSNIDCYYLINAERIDGEPLVVEYEGSTPADYPGSSDQYSISGHDYGRKSESTTP
jgi:hypothetical protein